MDNQKISITNKEIKFFENGLTKVIESIQFVPVPFKSNSEISVIEALFPTDVKPRNWMNDFNSVKSYFKRTNLQISRSGDSYPT